MLSDKLRGFRNTGVAAASPEGSEIGSAVPVVEPNRIAISKLAPSEVYFDNADIEINGRRRQCFGIREFAYENSVGWLDAVKQVPSARLDISVKPSELEQLAKSANREGAAASIRLQRSTNAMKETEAAGNHAQAYQLAHMLTERCAFADVSIMGQVEQDTAKETHLVTKNLSGALKSAGIELDLLPRGQERAFRACDPIADQEDEYLAPRFVRTMPVASLAAAEPFDAAGLIDEEGTILGKDGNGAIVRADLLSRRANRTSGNGLVVGPVGMGKSHLLKLIAASEYATQNARVVWIDFEQEGKYVCKRLHGQYVNGGGRGTQCCPTQYRALNFDYVDDGDREEDGDTVIVDVLRSTISFLEGFYQLAFEIPNSYLPCLDIGLVEAYRRHGVTYETPYSAIDFQDYPSMDEVAEVFREFAAAAENPEEARIYSALAGQTARGGKDGVFGNLWSGETNISLESDFIVFDCSALLNMADSARNAQLYSILAFIWSEVCRSRVSGKPLRLIVDEAHMILGASASTEGEASTKGSPIAASFLAMIVRRARKYNANVIVATQSLEDFYAASVAEKAKAIFENSTYFFSFAPKDPEFVEKTLRIPHERAQELCEWQKGHCVLRAGNILLELRVTAADNLQGWLGNAGGK